MHLNWEFLKLQFGNRFWRKKMKITQTQPRYVLKLSIDLKFGTICT